MVVKHISQNCSISLSFGVNETISETHHLATSIATMLRGSPMICGDGHMHSRPRLHGCPRSRITSELCSWSYLIPVFCLSKIKESSRHVWRFFFEEQPSKKNGGDVGLTSGNHSRQKHALFQCIGWHFSFRITRSIETVPTSMGQAVLLTLFG